MKTILPSTGTILKILGRPKSSDNGFRLMHFVLARPIEEGVLLFHTLTRELLLLTREEYDTLQPQQTLRERWFLVPQDMIDCRYADQVRFVRKNLRSRKNAFTVYTIFPTTDCNARCFYCYELGRSRIAMSEQTAHKAAAFIAGHCGGEQVRLNWFGGEPLFNRPAIDIICRDLAERGIAYTSSMVSNAYLFDDNAVKQAVELWKLKWVQITLDGTEHAYNHCKAYIHSESASPYQVVMENIGRLLDVGIRVFIRLNIGSHNADDLLLLADELHERFGDRKGLSAYSHVLFEYAGNRPRLRTEEDRRALYRKQRLLIEKLEASGLNPRHGLRQELRVNRCMADSDNALTILPGGELGLCEHYSEDHFVGHIDREGLDRQVVESFRQTRAPIAECGHCVSYPECIRLEQCMEQEECFPEMREEYRRSLMDAMLVSYQMWRKKEPRDPETFIPDC